ncbi:MAG: DUF4011 domain-containing protein [Actinomycetales bacterium]
MHGPRVEIEVIASRFVNQAMAHNRVGFVQRIGIHLPGALDPVERVHVQAELRVDETVLSRPWHTVIEALEPGRPYSIDTPPIRLDPAQISAWEEQTEAEIVVMLTLEGSEPVISYTPIRVLAASQWLIDAQAPLRSIELLAAFVQPNHPVLAPLLGRIGDRLMRTTKNASLEVVNVDAKRVDAIVRALCEEIQDVGIAYAEPPASWGYGQKVRSAGEVLEHRLGTCLDTTLLLASAMEAIGVAPVLWLAQGHAFVGWWRQPGQALPDAVSLQVTSAVNAVDLELVGVLETTLLTRERRPPRAVFRRATQHPLDTYLRTGAADLIAVVDVAMTRTLGLLPLPARHTRRDGVVEVVEYHPPALPDHRRAGVDDPSTPAATRPADGRGNRGAEPAIPPPPRVQAWKNALLDLSLRNPLLNLGGRATQLPLVLPHAGLGLLTDLLQDGQPALVRAGDDLEWAVLDGALGRARALPGDTLRSMLSQHRTVFSDLDRVRHQYALDRLRYRARTAIQESGANLLTLTLGRLDWTLGDRDLSAPLLIAQVELKGAVGPPRLLLDPAGGISLNLSLLEKLRHEFGFAVPELDDLPQRRDRDGVDVPAVLMAVRTAIAAAGLPFRVDEEARLAIIAFTGYLLWRDLDEHWATFLQRPLVRHLALTPTLSFRAPAPDGATPVGDDAAAVSETTDPQGDLVPADADLDEITAAAPIPADGSQARAIAAARAGTSFVLEGPPGTGKSQTITNLIADQLAHGRTVLFVAEKGAALDVVRRRLEDVGLLPFTLDLHDDQARPTHVRRQLKTALTLQPHPDEHAYAAAAGEVAACAATLRDYARRVHEQNPAGLSLYSARELTLARGHGPALSVPVTATSARDTVIRAVPSLALLDEPTWNAWGFVGEPPADQVRWLAQVRACDEGVSLLAEKTSAPCRQVLDTARSPGELGALAELLRPDSPDPHLLREAGRSRWNSAHGTLTERTQELVGSADLGPFDATVIHADLDQTRRQLREAGESFFIGRKARLLRAAGPVLGHVRPGAHIDPRSLPEQVEAVLVAAREHHAVLSQWQQLPGLGDLSPELNLLTEQGRQGLWDRVGLLAHRAELLAGLSPEAERTLISAHRAGVAITETEYHQAQSVRTALTAVLDGVGGDLPALHAWLDECAGSAGDVADRAAGKPGAGTGSSEVAESTPAGAGLLRIWQRTTEQRTADLATASRLHRWCEAVAALSTLRVEAPQARWALLTGAVPAHDAVAAFERGLARESLTERLETGSFAIFNSEVHDRTVSRFVRASQELRDTLDTVLPATVVRRRPFTPGRLVGRAARLEREVNRGRGGLSVRQLIQTYGSVIAEVTPCVLVSPDSLARFVPPDAMPFDLVVFDEASQITVADAIGALGRADAAVVAGDSKQLPPTAFGSPSAGSDEIDDPAADFMVVPDEESILSEAVQSGLPRLWLTWHYRSRDEALIAFSNEHYYEGRLLSFPGVPGRGHDTGVSLTQVPGRFIRSAENEGTLRTNPVEAAAVVAEVLRRWRTQERLLGVVTFNLQQRDLIERMLAEAGEPGVAESLRDRHDGLFVKNLENVQGDERDVIIFSTGFSANDAGILPLNFGPLNRVGGERRLNVAVTRARRRVMVFSSFAPQDLRADQTSSLGIKHLRAYLDAAADGQLPQSTGTLTVDRHRDELAAAMRERGWQVRTGLGMSDFQLDLTVAGTPGEAADGELTPHLAVLLDSPAWARRLTTNDRDGLPITVLHHQLGWPGVARVWLPDWIADPHRVLQGLDAIAHQARTQVHSRGGSTVSWTSAHAEPVSSMDCSAADPAAVGVQGSVDAEPPAQSGAGTDPLPSASPSQGASAEVDSSAVPAPVTVPHDNDPLGLSRGPVSAREDFAPFEVTLRGRAADLDALTIAIRIAPVAELMREIVEREGPISVPRLARYVVRCHGVSRLTDVRLSALRAVVPADLRRDSHDGFVWPDSRDPLRWNGYRASEDLKERPLEDVAVIEIANAAADLTRSALGIDVEDLLRELVRVFGGTRVTPNSRPRLEQGVDLAVQNQRIRIAAGIASPI